MQVFSVTIKDLAIVKDFKGIIGPINIFIGPNNSGKSLISKAIINHLSGNIWFSDIIDNIREQYYFEFNVEPDPLVNGVFNVYYLPDQRIVIKLFPGISRELDDILKSLEETLQGEGYESYLSDIKERIIKIKDYLWFRVFEEYIQAKKSMLLDIATKLYQIWYKIIDDTYNQLSQDKDRYIISKDMLIPLKVDITDHSLYIYDNIQKMEISGLEPESLSGGVAAYFIINWLITVLSSPNKRIVIFLEEPENQSHPMLQIMMAEFIYKAIKFTTKNYDKVIYTFITTHSDFLVKTMQNEYLKDIRGKTKDNLKDFITIYYPEYVSNIKGYRFIKTDITKPQRGLIDSEMLIWLKSPIMEIEESD